MPALALARLFRKQLELIELAGNDPVAFFKIFFFLINLALLDFCQVSELRSSHRSGKCWFWLRAQGECMGWQKE